MRGVPPERMRLCFFSDRRPIRLQPYLRNRQVRVTLRGAEYVRIHTRLVGRRPKHTKVRNSLITKNGPKFDCAPRLVTEVKHQI
jgi:hypothetical protein